MDELDILVSKFANDIDKKIFRTYKISVCQKFWSFNTYYNLIYSLNPRSLPVFGGSGITSTGTVSGGINNLEEFNKFMNMYFDGFVINAKSTLDSLAHAASILFPVYNFGEDIYFNEDFKNKIGSKCATTQFYNQIKNIFSQQWFKDLLDFRNVTTHERLVEVKIVAVFTTTSDKVENITILLPDDIRAPKLTWTGKNELYPICDIFKSKIEELLTNTESAMINDLKIFNKMPIIF
jgi:hypothetical protein